MSKDKIGLRLYRHKKSPKWLKNIIYQRWMLTNWHHENRERKKNKNNVFEVYINNKDKVYFELPIKRDLISCNIIVNKMFYEYDYLLTIGNLLKQPTCILDVGANIGNHTLFFSKFWGEVKVYSFEPSSVIFKMLQRNIQLNNLESTNCFNIAVGNKMGSGRISYNGQLENNLGATKVDYEDAGEIQFITLDTFTLEHNLNAIDLVKIDVEGFELKVLKGMEQIIKEYNPYIWIEVLENNKKEAMELFIELNLSFISAPYFNKHNDYLLRRKQLDA